MSLVYGLSDVVLDILKEGDLGTSYSDILFEQNCHCVAYQGVLHILTGLCSFSELARRAG